MGAIATTPQTVYLLSVQEYTAIIERIAAMEAHIKKSEAKIIPAQLDPLYDTREAAAYMGVSDKTIYRLKKKGSLKFEAADGKSFRFRKSTLDTHLERVEAKKIRPSANTKTT